MAGLKVRRVSLPARCEICHQADRFDARRNSCSRCQEFEQQINASRRWHWQKQAGDWGTICGALVGLVAGFSGSFWAGAHPNSQTVSAAIATAIFGAVFGAIIDGGIHQIRKNS